MSAQPSIDRQHLAPEDAGTASSVELNKQIAQSLSDIFDQWNQDYYQKVAAQDLIIIHRIKEITTKQWRLIGLKEKLDKTKVKETSAKVLTNTHKQMRDLYQQLFEHHDQSSQILSQSLSWLETQKTTLTAIFSSKVTVTLHPPFKLKGVPITQKLHCYILAFWNRIKTGTYSYRYPIDTSDFIAFYLEHYYAHLFPVMVKRLFKARYHYLSRTLHLAANTVEEMSGLATGQFEEGDLVNLVKKNDQLVELWKTIIDDFQDHLKQLETDQKRLVLKITTRTLNHLNSPAVIQIVRKNNKKLEVLYRQYEEHNLYLHSIPVVFHHYFYERYIRQYFQLIAGIIRFEIRSITNQFLKRYLTFISNLADPIIRESLHLLNDHQALPDFGNKYSQLIKKLRQLYESAARSWTISYVRQTQEQYFNQFLDYVAEAAEQIPETIVLSRPLRDKMDLVDLKNLLAEPVQFELRQSMVLKIDELVSEPIREMLTTHLQPLAEFQSQYMNIIRLELFNLEQKSSDASEEYLKEINQKTVEGIERIEAIKDKLTDNLTALSTNLEQLIIEAEQKIVYELLDALSDSQSQQARITEIETLFQQITFNLATTRKQLSHWIGDLWYRRHELKSSVVHRDEKPTDFIAHHLFEFIKRLSGRSRSIQAIPLIYQRLFLTQSPAASELMVHRPEESKIAAEFFQHFNEGTEGAIAFIGRPDQGKTSFIQHLVRTHLNRYPVKYIYPPSNRSYAPEDIHNAISKSFNSVVGKDARYLLNQQERPHVIVFEDIEKWFMMAPEGLRAIDEMIDIIEHGNMRHLFIISTTPWVWKWLIKTKAIDQTVFGSIRLSTLSVKELENLILTRHHTSGLNLHIKSKPFKDISRRERSEIFYRLHSDSKGSIDLAMWLWYHSVSKVDQQDLYLTPNQIYPIPDWDGVPVQWLVILRALIWHRQCSKTHLLKITGKSSAWLDKQINEMSRSKLINRDEGDMYAIHGHLEPYIIDHFTKKDWL